MLKKIGYAALSAAISLAATTYAQSQTAIGTAVSVDAQVRGNNSRQITTASSVFANERISANQTGLGQFEFSDGTKIVVGPGSTVVLDELVYNPDGSSFNKFVLETTSGAVRFISGNSSSNSYEVRTPVGTLGLRGTAFDLQHLNGRTYVMIIDGILDFCSVSGTCEVLRRKCDFAVATTNGGVTPPTQPRTGGFGARDMARLFPFANDQSRLDEGFRLRINTCAGGAAAGAPGGGSDANQGIDLDPGFSTSD